MQRGGGGGGGVVVFTGHWRILLTKGRQCDNAKSLSISWRQHYTDVIVTTIASQITSLTVVYSTVYSDADQRKHQSSASLAYVWGHHRDRWIPRTKGQLRGKCFHLMTSSWACACYVAHNMTISPEGYEEWHPHNWPVTTTNHLPPHLANYLGHQRVSVFV